MKTIVLVRNSWFATTGAVPETYRVGDNLLDGGQFGVVIKLGTLVLHGAQDKIIIIQFIEKKKKT